MHKVAGVENPAELFTKYMSADTLKGALERMSVGMTWRPLSRMAQAARGCGR